MPIYRNRSKIPDEKLAEQIRAETWLSAADMQEAFDIEVLEDEKAVDAIDPELFSDFKHTPDCIREAWEEQKETEKVNIEPEDTSQDLDWYFDLLEKTIQSI